MTFFLLPAKGFSYRFPRQALRNHQNVRFCKKISKKSITLFDRACLEIWVQAFWNQSEISLVVKCGRQFGGSAADAIKFSGLAWLFVFLTTVSKEFCKNNSLNQHRTFVDNSRKSFLNPVTDSIFVNAEPLGNFFHRIAAVNLDKTGVGVTFFYDSSPPRSCR